MSVRAHQAVALRRATVRSVRWPPALVAVLFVAGLVAWKRDALDAPGSGLLVLRIAAILLALGAVFVLEDDAAVSVASSPTPLWWRRALRCGVAAAILLPAWAGVLAYAHSLEPELPWARLSLELAVLVTVGLAVAGVVSRRLDVLDSGMTAALSVLGFALAGVYLPPRLVLFTTPGSASWDPSTLRWTGVLTLAAVVLAVATRDPARTVRRSGAVRR